MGVRDGAGHEIEIKLAVADVAAIRRRLAGLRAARGPRVHEVNAVFDTPEQWMRRRGQLLRLRVERRAGPSAQAQSLATSLMAGRLGRARVAAIVFPPRGKHPGRRSALVTLKAPVGGARQIRNRAGYKIRREVEFAVADPNAFRQMLAYLGFHPAFYYEKFRTEYRLPGIKEVVVSLDETPIGAFLELEGPPREIDRARKLLGYVAREAILLSYGGLNAAYRRARGLVWGDMLFGRIRKGK
jgi:adenylate cyclase, class 2